MADRIGQQLGNYRLIRLLGEGGFAEVYLGEHIHLNTQAAIKVLHTQLASDAVEKFRTEARTVAHLLHPSIVRILDFGIEDRTPFLVMDYAPQGTLRQRHPKGTQLPITTIVTYAKQLAEALQYAHNEKLIHRDVKPENMLVGRRNEVLLSDFGIAIVAQSSSYPRTLDMAGTIAYMAPEQIHAHPRPASDQYSLGIVVYEWLSGDRPFHGSFTEIAIKHCNVPPPSLREKFPTISPSIEQVVMKALAKNPKERFENVQEFTNALEHANQSSNPIIIKPLPPKQLVEPHPPKKRLAVNSPPLGTVLVTYHGHKTYAHVITWSPDGKYIASGSSDGTVQVWDAATGQHVLTYRGHSDSIWDVAWSPDGTRIVSVSNDETVRVWSATTGGTITYCRNPIDPSRLTDMPDYLKGSKMAENCVAWSPDGKRIVSGTYREAQVWDAATGQHVLTYRGHSGWVQKLVWSANGRYIVSASSDVQVWDAATGQHVLTYRGHSSAIFDVAWSPDGKYIVSGGGDPANGKMADNTVRVWDAATGQHVLTYRGHYSTVNCVVWSPDGKYIASGSSDGTVQVWDAATGHNIFTYQGHSRPVQASVWSPDGMQIASVALDDAVHIWQAASYYAAFRTRVLN